MMKMISTTLWAMAPLTAAPLGKLTLVEASSLMRGYRASLMRVFCRHRMKELSLMKGSRC
jgi:hypothetical protein